MIKKNHRKCFHFVFPVLSSDDDSGDSDSEGKEEGARRVRETQGGVGLFVKCGFIL